VSAAAGRTDEVSARAESLADDIATLLARLADLDGDAVLPTVRIDAARELAGAAARLRHAAARIQVAAAGLVEHQQVHRYDAATTTRKWLAQHTGISHREASALCRATATKERFPTVGDAFQAGRLTHGHLEAVGNIVPSRFKGEALAEAIEKVRGIQDLLVGTAEQSTVDEFADFCHRVRDRLDHDGPGDPGAEPSRIWLHRLFNGRWSLSGDLSPDDGAILATILADLRARRSRAESAADDGAATATATSTASEPAAGETADATSADDAAPTYSETQARDLLDLIVSGAGSGRSGRVGVYLHIDLDDLNAPTDEAFEASVTGRRSAHTDAGYDISDDTLWGLMGNADVTPVFNRNGTSLWYGRSRRLASPELRRIIAHRDRRCRFPGCDRSPIWCDAHHVHHWEDDGPTDPGNCVSLCRAHHHDHHDRNFGIEGDAGGVLEFTRPDGSRLDAAAHYVDRRKSEPRRTA